MKNLLTSFLIILFPWQLAFGESASSLMQKGWEALVRDNDTIALTYFSQAFEEAKAAKDFENSGNALLNMGICSYGTSLTFGLNYCLKSMDEFKKLEKTSPQTALTGRSKCLQLISTIKSRQGKYRESISISREAMAGFPETNDTSGYLGLIYNSLGIAYKNLNLPDSSEYFHRLALQERLLTNKLIYLPASLINVADIDLIKGDKAISQSNYNRALFIADSMGNRQAQVIALIGTGKWLLHFENNLTNAEINFMKAKTIGSELTDKSFYLNALGELVKLKKIQKKYPEALAYSEEIEKLKDSLYIWEKERITKNLEVQFDIAEKDRQLSIVQEEKNIAALTNYILWGTIGFLIFIAAGIILFLRKINKRDKMILRANEQLSKIAEEQKRLKEQQLQNEIEFKESQLSALAVQMLQKNELLQELDERLTIDKDSSVDNQIRKIINKGLNQDKEWSDFNTYFEGVNKNFYSRIKLEYPDISPNDLKICALIKLNLSIKEMAAILNISPDSVKTARYRLRKKLQLNSEDNLTDFILNLK